MNRLASARSLLAASMLLAPGLLPAQVASHMVLEKHLPFPACTTTDVWAMGDYMLVARQIQGFSVVDIRDPQNPVVATIAPPGYPVTRPGLGVGDIKSDGRHLYVTDGKTGAGVFIYDTVPDPMNPTLVSTVRGSGPPVFGHNCWIEGDWLYVQNLIYDVSDRANPRFVTKLGGDGIFSNDVIVLDDVAYAANWLDGIAIWDVRDPTAPVLLGNKDYPNAKTHNMWPTDDRRYLFVSDEITVAGVGAPVRVWDISELPAITEVAQIKIGPPDSVVHNVIVRGDLLFIAYFKEGLRVLSIADPINPVEIAYYDTYLPTANGCHGDFTAGAWGVYPWRAEEILVGDVDSGAYILRLDPIGQTLQAGTAPATPARGHERADLGRIDVDFRYRNDAPAALGAFGAVVLTGVNGTPTHLPLFADARTLAAGASIRRRMSLPLPNGIEGLTLDFTGYTGTTSPILLSERRTTGVVIE